VDIIFLRVKYVFSPYIFLRVKSGPHSVREKRMSPTATRERTNMSKLMVQRTVVDEDGCVGLMVVGEK